MRHIKWAVLARDDLAEIDAYWWIHNPGRAEGILSRIEAGAEFLLGAPHAGPPLDGSPAREWSVRGTRYLLIYRVFDDRVEILRVCHESQNWPAFE